MKKLKSRYFLKAISILGIAVFALSACGGGGSDTPPTPPSAPANLTADAGDSQVILNWPSVSGAATYNVYYGTSAGVTTSSTKITGSVSGPKTVTGLTNDTPYFFAVSAVNAAGESSLSVERSATPSTTPPPGAPTNIRGSAGGSQVTVSWDSVAGATSYNIYYATAAGVTKASGTPVAGVSSPYDVTGLTNGTTYFFVVTAENGNGESGASFEVSVKPMATPPPAAPSLTSATTGNSKVTLAWISVAGATSYNVYYGTASGVTKASGTKIAGVSSPYDVTGLTNGTPYFFVVTAQDANGESAESNERSATPSAPPAAFNQADLTGTWRMNLLKNGTDTEWDRARISINSSGVAACLSVDGSFAGGNTCPSPFDLTFTMNTTTGVITQSGDHAVDDGGHMTMTSNKNF
ncbi:MAG: fibronectin type III domain-containing protein, partial [Pseudomonadota bacterium]